MTKKKTFLEIYIKNFHWMSYKGRKSTPTFRTGRKIQCSLYNWLAVGLWTSHFTALAPASSFSK